MTPNNITIPAARQGEIAPLVLDARLGAALPFLRGGVMADVGTDHAYLPIAALQQGLATFAVATDIHKGPAEVAAAHLSANGVGADRAAVLLTDGLHGAESFGADDVMIFGMGGELIVRILAEADWVKDPAVGLILQPMTRIATLREWLLQNGFEITGETITYEDKFYQTVAARYSGEIGKYDPVELLLGRHNLNTRPPLFEGLVRHEIHVLNAIVNGKSKSLSADVSEELRMIARLEELL